MRRAGIIFVIATILVAGLPFKKAFASISGCTVTVSPDTVQPGSQTNFNFAITNNDPSQDIQSIHVLRPSADYTMVDGHTNFWDTYTIDTEIDFSNGTLSAGQTQNIGVEAIAGQSVAGDANWSVYVSDQADGSGSVSCGGQLSTNITTQAPFNTADVGVSAVMSSSATINWSTNLPASSKVVYGKTASYGQTAELGGNNLVTQHSIGLTNLQPKTTYHYQTQSTNGNGQFTSSSDNTFITAPVPVVPVTPAPGPGTSTTSVTNVSQISLANNQFIKAVPTETIAPTIKSNTVLQKIYKDTPTISGQAADNVSVALVEYSVDGGANWLPTDVQPGLGTATTPFSFTPKGLQDGNYDLMVRVTDSSRNQTSLKLGTIVIDKLPPTVGGNNISVGSQFVQPDSDGTMRALAGVDQKIIVSAVGGATAINIGVYTDSKSDKPTQVFGLSKSSSNGLWSGVLNFAQGGSYELRIKSVDGADNVTNRVLGNIIVKNKGKVTDAKTNSQTSADVHVYYKDPQTGSWILWGAQSYGQANPASTTDKNGYGFYLPSGTYYLKITKPGYKTATTQSFTLSAPGSVSSSIALHKLSSAGKLFSKLPSFGLNRITLSDDTSAMHKKTTAAKAVPIFDLPLTDGNRVRTVDIYGKPAIISLVSSWSPNSQDQLPILAELAKEYPELRVIPVSSGESLSRLTAQSNIAGYQIPLAADADNSLLNTLDSSNLPTHYFIDRRGMVSKRVIGVLSKEEFLKYVTN